MKDSGSQHHELHGPQPSPSPAILALGVMFMAFGILWGVALLALGGLFFVIGLATWLIDDARAYQRAGEPSGEGHGHEGHSTA